MSGVASAALTIAGATLEVRRASGRDAVGERFRIHVDAALPGESAGARDLLGAPFVLKLSPPVGTPLQVHGIVIGLSATFAGGERLVSLELGPAVEPVAIGSDSRVFVDQSVVDVVKHVLTGAGIRDAKWSTRATYTKRTSITQHREDDWSFVERLLERAGIYYFFDHTGDATHLVLADDSTAAETVSPAIKVRTRFGARVEEPTISGLRVVERLTSDAVELRDRDPQRPALRLSAEKKGTPGRYAVYRWPGGFKTEAEGKDRAAVALEGLLARRTLFRGESDGLVVRCGKRFTLADHPVDALNAELFCVELSFAFEPGALRASWAAIPAKTRYRAEWGARRGDADGLESAVVVGASGQEIDADEQGRVVAHVHWDRQAKEDRTASARLRVGQLQMAGGLATPRIGWEVLMAHHDDDLDRSWVLGKLVDGTHPLPYATPGDATRSAWQTMTSPGDGTSSEFSLEDKSGSEEIFLAAARDHHLTVGDGSALTVGNDHELEVKGGRTWKIGADEKLSVSKDGTIEVKGGATTEIDGSRSVTVKGGDKGKVGGKRSIDVSKASTTDVDGGIKLSVGGGAKLSADGDVAREVLKKHALRGAGLELKTDDGLAIACQGDASETVAGARTLSAKGVMNTVKGNDTITVAAAHVVTAKGGVSEGCSGKMTLDVGAAMALTASGIEIAADSEIAFACGGTTLVVKSDSVEVKSTALTATAPMIVSNGATVKHNP